MKKHLLVLAGLIVLLTALFTFYVKATDACIARNGAQQCDPSEAPTDTMVISAFMTLGVFGLTVAETTYLLYRFTKKTSHGA